MADKTLIFLDTNQSVPLLAVDLGSGTAYALAVDIQDASITATVGGIAGDVAHDAADSGNPLKMGARARTSDLTAVANNDRTDLVADKIGRQIVLPFCVPENRFSGTSSADVTDTSTQTLVTAVSAVKYCITNLAVSNLHASVNTRVDLMDGTNVLWQGPAACLGGGFTIAFNPPLVGTANSIVGIKCGTTGAAVRGSVSGFKEAG